MFRVAKTEKALCILKAALALALLQLCRAAVEAILFLFIPRTLFTDTIVSAFVMSAMIFPVLLFAGAKRIPLSVFPARKAPYGILAALVFLLIASTPFVTGDRSLLSVCGLIYSAVITPVFEELLFRGLLWSKLKAHFQRELSTYGITTLLFALWHLGYIDGVSYRMGLLGSAGLPFAMLMKVAIGLCFGAVLGAVRLKTKNCFSTILLHAVMNLFGR